jgi:type II secretory pathway pseudopilin PulG
MPKSGQPRSLRVSQRKQNQAFTTIELLVVVGILVVLIGIAFVAFRGVTGGAAAKSTKTVMGGLSGMLAELEAANGLKSQPVGWVWWSGAGIVNAPQAAGATYAVDFWKLPYRVGNAAAGAPDALVAPGDVSESNVGANGLNPQRDGSIAVVNTTLAMAQLAAVKNNKEAIGRTAKDSTFVPRYISGNIRVPGSAGYLGYNDSGATVSARYPIGAHVSHVLSPGQPVTMWASTADNPGQPGAAGWQNETSSPYGAPVFLDGWHNPIIFVPATGLKVRLLNGKSALAAGERTQNFIIVSPEGTVDNNGSSTVDPVVVSLGRPFWASAGPDGDFSKGDDNVYSFGE